MKTALTKFGIRNKEEFKALQCDNEKRFLLYLPVLAQGTSSQVFVGKDLMTNKTIIVKEYSLDDKGKEAIKKELNILPMLEASGIVCTSLSSPIKTENNLYSILNFCEYGSLKEYSHVFFSRREIQQIAKFLGKVLIELQAKNISHNSLSPEHILVYPEKDEIKYLLTGFSGSEKYSKKYFSQKDILDAGLVLYELTTGKRPGSVSKDFVILHQKAKKLLLPPDSFPIDKDLEDLILKCISYDLESCLTPKSFQEHSFLSKDFSPKSKKDIGLLHSNPGKYMQDYINTQKLFLNKYNKKRLKIYNDKYNKNICKKYIIKYFY